MTGKNVEKTVFREAVRLFGTDLNGNLKVCHALMGIKGLGFTMAKAIVVATGIDPTAKIGSLSDKDIKKIESMIKNPNTMPFLLNRRISASSGKHLVGGDLMIAQKQDIARLKKLGCYRGLRHRAGLPVRGQRTRTSFRTGGTVGVMRKKAAAQRGKGKK